MTPPDDAPAGLLSAAESFARPQAGSGDPLWYKDAIVYQLHIKAFFDANNDGIGDFEGLTRRLDYLQDLGVTALWLLPFYPSPLRDDGYDIADYRDVHPGYGTLKDVRRLIHEAHRRGLRVITELVINHTSDQHPWFQRARRARPGSTKRNYYVWSDTDKKYQDTRIIFIDTEKSNWTWDPEAQAYFWHRFYSHQPDLNFDNPAVMTQVLNALHYWLEMGVDGLRLDAIPYLVEREGTNCENLPETHAVLKRIRAEIDTYFADRMLLAEANQWPEDTYPYFGNGDECHMAFHFPLMPRMYMAIAQEDRNPITDIMRQTPEIPESCQWAIFLRNHDELTLEMVTQNEREYLWNTYAADRRMRINLGIRRRLAPLLENDRRKIELMNALLLSMPGTPVIYYGDEIGMGDNIYLGDRDGVRTPMQWSPDRNGGFSRGNPQKLYLPVNIDPQYHYEALNVETQNNNSHSLLWWMKRMIAQRKQHPAFGRGKMEILFPANRKILAFVREFEGEKILVVANLSRFTQCAELDLSRHRESVPVEVFGRNNFPAITEQPYLLSLGPHAFQWFHLQPREHSQESLSVTARAEDIPVLAVDAQEIFGTSTRNAIAKLLPLILRRRSWFARKHRTIRHVRIHDVIALPETMAHILRVNVEYTDGEPETFTVPLSLATGEHAETILRERLYTVLAKVKGLSDPQSILYGSVFDRQFNDALPKAMLRRRRIKGENGDIVGTHTRAFREAWGRVRSNLEPQPQTLDAHKILVTLGQDFVFTLYREVEAGQNPDREIGEFLTNHTNFPHIARTLGAIEYRATQDDETETVTTLGTLTSYVRNAADGWMYTLDQLGLFFERALAIGEEDPRLKELKIGTPFALSSQPVPRVINELLGGHAETAVLLGRCAAEMHAALSSHPEMPDFAPEPITEFYRHGLYHGLLAQMNKSLDALGQNVERLSGAAQEEARAVLEQQGTLRERFNALRDMRISGTRTRHHGDYHLGNVLYTGSDFIIKNFDGDYTRPMSERRIKRSPIKDVASMVRSLHYVSHAVLFNHVPGIVTTQAADWRLERW